MAVNQQENGNLIVLGIIIRSRRIEYGYSLRTLADITKISHTLISNIEMGKQVPAKDTLSEIFSALDLKFHKEEGFVVEGLDKIRKITKLIMHQEYDDAELILAKLIKNEKLYLFSPLIIDYILVKYVFYAITNKLNTDIDEAIDHYSNVYKFFGPIQKQLWKLMVGLNQLNHEKYSASFKTLNEGLSMGNKEYDVFIKEYLVIGMVRQYKFMDAQKMANEAIAEFEQRTIYVRAMKLKLQIARIYLVIKKNAEILELLDQVENFAAKFKNDELMIESTMLRANLALNNKDYKLVEEISLKMPGQESLAVALVKFKLAYELGQIDELKKVYKRIMKFPSVHSHYKITKYLTMKIMYKVPEMYDDELYLEYVTFLCEKSVENNDQEIIGIAYNHLLEYYYSKRQYKKASEVAFDFLQNKRLLRKL